MKLRRLILASSLTLAAACTLACTQVGDRSEHIPLNQTPPAVMAGFQREFPGLVLGHTDIVHTANGETEYNLKFRDATRRYHQKLFSADGRLLEDKSSVTLPLNQPAAQPPMPGQPMPPPANEPANQSMNGQSMNPLTTMP